MTSQQKLRTTHICSLESLSDEFRLLLLEKGITDSTDAIYMAGMVDVESWNLINRVMGK